MKTVFDNRKLGHIWAAQSQQHGRSNSMKFDGPRIYSYSTCIGMIHTSNGAQLVLLNERRYSMTTSSKHMPAVNGAITHLDSVYVPICTATSAAEHRLNLEYLVSGYENMIAKNTRARFERHWWREEFDRYAGQIARYSKFFRIRAPKIDPAGDFAALMETRRLWGTPEAKATREKARKAAEIVAKRKGTIAAQKLEADRVRKVAEFRAGQNLYGLSATDEKGGAYLRLDVDGQHVQTSRGASVNRAEAIAAIKFIRAEVAACVRCDAPFSRRDNVMVGDFRITEVRANGDTTIGCHFIQGAEIELLAKSLGV